MHGHLCSCSGQQPQIRGVGEAVNHNLGNLDAVEHLQTTDKLGLDCLEGFLQSSDCHTVHMLHSLGPTIRGGRTINACCLARRKENMGLAQIGLLLPPLHVSVDSVSETKQKPGRPFSI